MDAHYRVAIFGSARIKAGDKEYQEVFSISKGLAEAGFDIVTGGGPGIMQAANSGHKSVSSDTHSIGLNIKLPFEQHDNKYLDIKKDFDRFSDRLDTFLGCSMDFFSRSRSSSWSAESGSRCTRCGASPRVPPAALGRSSSPAWACWHCSTRRWS